MYITVSVNSSKYYYIIFFTNDMSSVELRKAGSKKLYSQTKRCKIPLQRDIMYMKSVQNKLLSHLLACMLE